MPRSIRSAVSGLFLLSAALVAGGCGESFTNEEMHLGPEAKPRPLAVLCEPPEAAPGEQIAITLVFHESDASASTVAWRAALDYNPGMYGADVVERRLVDLDAETDIPPFVDDGHGFRTQTFSWTVPDSTLLMASSLPDLIDDPAIVALATVLLPDLPPEGVTKRAIDAYLRALAPADLASMDAATLAAHRDLSDLFACQIRLRARLTAGFVVDVKRSLTVRYSRALDSSNVNTNPEIAGFEVIGIPEPDVDWSDIETYRDRLEHYPFGGDATVSEARVPFRADWTYYVTMLAVPQTYTSPFSPGRLFEEQSTVRWYFFRLDDPGAGQDFFVDDEGEAAEMWALDEEVRLQPPTDGDSPRFRVALCARDQRVEWEMYQGTPGATLVFGDIVFE